MAENTIKTRIQLKNDTEANWRKSVLTTDHIDGEKVTGSSFVPLKGELIIFSTDESHPFSRIKIGDGVQNVLALPFVGSSNVNNGILAATTEEWYEQYDFVPNNGDIIIYTDKAIIDDVAIPGIKIGDGSAYGIDLPFVADDVATNLLEHISDTVCHITNTERLNWNNKINCEDTVVNETLVFTR